MTCFDIAGNISELAILQTILLTIFLKILLIGCKIQKWRRKIGDVDIRPYYQGMGQIQWKNTTGRLTFLRAHFLPERRGRTPPLSFLQRLSQGECYAWCRIEWCCRTNQSCWRKALQSRPQPKAS